MADPCWGVSAPGCFLGACGGLVSLAAGGGLRACRLPLFWSQTCSLCSHRYWLCDCFSPFSSYPRECSRPCWSEKACLTRFPPAPAPFWPGCVPCRGVNRVQLILGVTEAATAALSPSACSVSPAVPLLPLRQPLPSPRTWHRMLFPSSRHPLLFVAHFLPQPFLLGHLPAALLCSHFAGWTRRGGKAPLDVRVRIRGVRKAAGCCGFPTAFPRTALMLSLISTFTRTLVGYDGWKSPCLVQEGHSGMVSAKLPKN